jgi:hypothetical protein
MANERDRTNDGPPPLPSKPNGSHESNWKTKLKDAALSAKATSIAAAKVAAKKSERTKILNVDLPKAYAALGRDVHGRNAHRDDFPDIYSQIDALSARLTSIERRAQDRPKGTTVGEKAKAVGAAAKDKAEAQACRLKMRPLMTALGKAAFEKHGSESGPNELAKEVEGLLARVEKLEEEMDEIRQSDRRAEGISKWLIGALILFLAAIPVIICSGSIKEKYDDR